MTDPFFGNFDVAQLALYAFWIFFAGLIIYLQRENSREGYPLEHGVSGKREVGGLFGQPDAKTFKLPHDLGDRTLDRDGNPDDRSFGGDRVERGPGTAYEPSGDPMTGGLGPAAYAERPDRPDLNGHGEPKIVPMSGLSDWSLVSRSDPRGYTVHGGDGQPAGTISDLWVDTGEQIVRYFEVETSGGPRLVPATAVIVDNWGRRASVYSLYAEQFAGIPVPATGGQITMLEEEKVMAYVSAGRLYAGSRREALI